ncbi:hypothetical protein [Nostoc sp. FACHB-280]|uniref:hypothetical protein n=1 Tax=Nostoc sp. FACHB-280 TaxID=2692839 RepID=UPI00168A7B85|nr:hypothetical protein [Nostoc sp. FACHB-280]MBD2495337.1 hypothetical protein [Nostoc sp. FACHB-280]
MFANILRRFSDNLDTLRDFVDLVNPILDKAREEAITANPNALIPLVLGMNAIAPEKFCLDTSFVEHLQSQFDGKLDIQVEEEGNKSAKLSFNNSGGDAFHSTMAKLSKRSAQKGLLYQNALISLVSAVEWFLSQLLHKYFELYPDAAGIRERSLTLSELQLIGTIDEAKNYLIGIRIEEILRGSFSDWITFMKGNLKLSMGYLEDDEKYLIEICQRRNLFVHNGGIVNKIYLNKSGFTNIGIGEQINVSQEYLDEAIARFERFFFLVSLELWKKLAPDDKERANIVSDITYKNLCNERWKIAESLSFFLMNDKQLPEMNRLISQINYWQSLKWQDRFTEVRKDVERIDFSAKNEIFSLAQSVLLDDEQRFFQLLPILLKAEKLSEKDLHEWPLFRKIRNTDTFKTIYNPKLVSE